MIAIKGMEMPKNCIECDHLDLREALGCQLIYSGCANCGRHSDCPLVEIVTCKNCKHKVFLASDGKENTTYMCNKHCKNITNDDFYCKDGKRRK